MKFPLLLITSLALLSAGGFYYLEDFSAHYTSEGRGEDPSGEEGRENERDGMREAMQQEFLKTRDPRTNTVPVERMYKAIAYYAAEARIRTAEKGTGVNNFNSLTWTERGPSAIGGRTRALLFDANDATHKRVFAGSVGGGLWRCNDITAAAPVWTPVNDQFANLAITCIAQDPASPATLYFGTGEGWYNGDAIRGGGIWKSTNGGSTWANLPITATSSDFNYVQKILVTSSGVYAACRSVYCNTGGLQRSTNGGASFSRVLGTNTGACATSTEMFVADLETGASGDLYATTEKSTGAAAKIWRSPAGATVGDAGTWTNITPAAAASGFDRIEIGTAPGTAGRIYALFDNSTSDNCTAIYTTTNGNSAAPVWTACTVPTIYDQGNNSNFARGQAWYDLICAVDPNNDQVAYIGAVDILKTTNAGTSWKQITSWSLYNANNSTEPSPFFSAAQNVHADQHAFVFVPGSSTAALSGSDGGIYYSTDLGTAPYPSWDAKNTGYNVTQYYSAATHPGNTNYFLAGAQDNGSQKFTAAGINTGISVSGGDGAFCYISKLNGNNQLTAYVYNNLYRSTNGGVSFSTVAGGTSTGQFINPGDLDNTNEILYTAGNANQLVRWSGVFATVARTNLTVAIGSAKATAIKVSPNNPTTVYVGTGAGNIYRISSANGTPVVSQIATALGGASAGSVSNIDVWKKTSGTADDSMLVSLSNYGVESVYFTANGSSATPAWADLDDNSTLQDIPVRWAVFSPNDNTRIFLATETGVLTNLTFTGTTASWTSLNNSMLPLVRTDMIQFNSSNQMAVATHGRGLWTSSDVSPLPLRLLAFEARAYGQDVRLAWSVADQSDAASYIVERMYHDEQEYTPIAWVAPTASTQYAAADIQPAWARAPILYRLKCTSRDGASYYSAVARLTQGMDGNTLITAVYPTVTDDVIHIQTGNLASSAIRIAVVSMSGQVVIQSTLPYQSTAVHLGELARGWYLMTIQDAAGLYRQTIKVEKK